MNFDYLRKFEPIIIKGHDNPDIDSTISSIMFSRLLDLYEIKNEIVANTNADKVLIKHINLLEKKSKDKINSIKIREINKNENVFLVDCKEDIYSEQLEYNIIGYIDHHSLGEKIRRENIILEKSSCCAKLIYDLFIKPSKIEHKELIMAMVADTTYFKSPKTIIEEKEYILKLCKQLSIKINDFSHVGLCLTNIKNKKISEIIENGVKLHNNILCTRNIEKNNFTNNCLIKSSYIQTNGDLKKDSLDSICKVLSKKVKNSKKIKGWSFYIHNLKEEKTTRIFATKDFSFIKKFNTLIARSKDISEDIFRLYSIVYNQIDLNYDYKKYIIEKLTMKQETISTMESCTSGMVATTITNFEGSSNILHGSLITYNNDTKKQFGVSEDIINKYGVYSFETAIDMSVQIQKIFSSTYGIGVTGSIGNIDINNKDSVINHIYFNISQYINRNKKKLKSSINHQGKIIIYNNNYDRDTIKRLISEICLLELFFLVED